MDRVANLLNQLSASGIEVALVENLLRVRMTGGGAPPPAVLRELEDQKAGLIAFLRVAGAAHEPTFGMLQLDNELNFVQAQLAEVPAATGAAGAQPVILGAQRRHLREWLAWLDENTYRVPVTPVAERETYEPSAALRHFWIGFWFENTHVPFNAVTSYAFEDLDLDAFRRTCDVLTARHEILRTVAVFDGASGTVKQRVLPALDHRAVVTCLDVSHESNKDEIVARHLAATQEHIFDYERGPLLRFTVLRYDARRYRVLFNVSHAIFDGWSKNVFEEEFQVVYQAQCEGRPHSLKALPVQYKDFAAWENTYQQGGLAEGFARYWHWQSPDRYPARNLSVHFTNTPLADASYREALRRQIKPYLKSTDDRTISAFYGVVAKADRTRSRSYHFSIAGDTFSRLGALCRHRYISPYQVMIAGLNVLVYKITGTGDVVVGAHAALRDQEEIQGQLGFFVNTLLVRNGTEGKKTFSNLVTDVVVATTLAGSYRNYTLAKILDDLDIPFRAVNTFFLNMLPSHSEARLTDFAKGHDDNVVLGFFDIDLTVREYANGLKCWCAYDLGIYPKEAIAYLFDSFEHLLAACLRSPHVPLDAIALPDAPASPWPPPMPG